MVHSKSIFFILILFLSFFGITFAQGDGVILKKGVPQKGVIKVGKMMAKQGMANVSIKGYEKNVQPTNDLGFKKNGGKYQISYGKTAEKFIEDCYQMGKKKLFLIDGNQFEVGGEKLYCALWRSN